MSERPEPTEADREKAQKLLDAQVEFISTTMEPGAIARFLPSQLAQALAEARAEEREAFLRRAVERPGEGWCVWLKADEGAAAIRARGEARP